MRFFKAAAFAFLALFVGPVAVQAAVDSELSGVSGVLAWSVEGALETEALLGATDYDWWYGCSPTSTGMLLAYYDRNGYEGLSYSNLLSGATAEQSTFGNTSAAVNAMIASSGHIEDFYGGDTSGGSVTYGTSGDDTYVDRIFDCLADFMGTSQDSVKNSNGSTTFYYYNTGAAITYEDIVTEGVVNKSGMYGIYEYVQYAGYTVDTLYNQLITLDDDTLGFSFYDYMAEIDAGRGVLIHVTGHTMYGYGYIYDAENEVYQVLFHDTWFEGEHTMDWGGDYYGLSMLLVTVLELSGGDAVPEPTSLVVWALLGGLTIGYRRRRRRC